MQEARTEIRDRPQSGSRPTEFRLGNPGALAGLRVLDLSRVLAGPFCTMILGDLGADVIKVERPSRGDDTRQWGPPFAEDGLSAYFIACNRNKRSVAIDIKHPEGVQVIRHMAGQSDVLVENFKPGELERLAGLGYKDLTEINPQLIYCSITGFGQTGPRAKQPGYDFLIQAMGGLMSITGESEGEPMKVGVAVADLFAGLFATIAILAALEARRQIGRGQWIDLALYDCQLAMLANVASNFLISGEAPARYGNAHPNIVPYQAFSARDGYFALAVGNDRQWRELCSMLGCREWADDARFATNPDRVRNRRELIPLLVEKFSSLSVDEVVSHCLDCDIPAGPIRSIAQAIGDEQSRARSMVVQIGGSRPPIKMIGSPIRLTETPTSIRLKPPRLGEHTKEVLLEFGYSLEEVNALVQSGAVSVAEALPVSDV